MRHVRAAAGALTTVALLGLAAPRAGATGAAGTPDRAVAAPATLDTLSRFFARDGAAAAARDSRPRIDGRAVPVRVLSHDFVAGRAGAPVARVAFHAATAVAADGRKASVRTVRRGTAGWQVVNIATGDDEVRYAAEGARRLPGGTVFREPRIDAWYVHRGTEVLPLDEDAIRAVGADGTTLAGYRHRVRAAYADKLPGSPYAKEGRAGGYGTSAAPPGTAGASGTARGTAPRAATASAAAAPGSPFPAGPAAAAAAAAAAVATALVGARARRRHRRRP
ncbi:hypothetical protein [Streptomyces sp. NRRL S-118]|uniref:hypothetical protein n=1 Tax=Streptomyces sp. NRRL S-118 TaxID=1463881 RepID=UPI00099BD068|nr:hypothetical protein [Streptomyces sp. NRRL S-118]